MKYDVVVIGSLNYDILIQQDRLPHLGETFTGNALMMMPGGKGANQAVQCARLGLKVNMVGCVGQDIYGQELLQSLEKYNIQTDNIKRSGTSGVGIVQILSEGDYCSTIIKGANYHLSINDISEKLFQDKPLVVMQSEIPESVVNYVIERAAGLGCRILLNNAPAREVRPDILRKVDYLVVNETEAQYMTGKPVTDIASARQAADQLFDKTHATIIVTLGEKGAVVKSPALSEHFPAVSCPKVVDTTGAGDSFIGALACKIVRGMTLAEAMTFAAKVSAHSIQKYGGQSSFPSLEEVQPCSATV
ncbi:ribokinase [Erwinia sp. MMLR14_017]|uniref:ribokinase n=1 Tax=Erwinia sp. MMLR14_017 TaxID=3093842 RepID=UPI00298F6DEA|nr:ribokinase [Erwinia sp. MMLR14_017]MDW8847462.1 ribokinase [Erwinia sp. MMLR14_017]